MRGLLTSSLPSLVSLTLGGCCLSLFLAAPSTSCDHKKNTCLHRKERLVYGMRFPGFYLGSRALYLALRLVVMSQRPGVLAKAERYLTILC